MSTPEKIEELKSKTDALSLHSPRALRDRKGRKKPIRELKTSPQLVESHDFKSRVFCASDHQLGSLCFHPNPNLLATSSDNELRLWDLAASTSVEFPIRPYERRRLANMRFSPDGKWLAGVYLPSWVSPDQGKHVVVFDVVKREAVELPLAHGAEVRFVCFSPDAGKMASKDAEGTIALWDLPSKQLIKTLESSCAFDYEGDEEGDDKWSDSSCNQMCFSSDGKRLIVCDRNTELETWDIEEGTCTTTTEVCDGMCCLSADGKLRAIDKFTGICVETLAGKSLLKLSRYRGRDYSTGLCFSPDNNKLVVASRAMLSVWDLRTQEVAILDVQSPVVSAGCFSPDSAQLAFSMLDYVKNGCVDICEVDTLVPVKATQASSYRKLPVVRKSAANND